MGLLNRNKSKAPRAARSTRASNKRQPATKKKAAGSKVLKAGRQVLDSYTGGAFSTLASREAGMKPRKRMNVMNAKAVRRAATRVRGSIKMLERLKKSLPHVSAKGKVTVRKAKR